MGEFGFGQSVRRKEDPRLLTGRGCYIEDRHLEGECHAVMLRSPHAHAILRSIGSADALTEKGRHRDLQKAVRRARGLVDSFINKYAARCAEAFGHLIPGGPFEINQAGGYRFA